MAELGALDHVDLEAPRNASRFGSLAASPCVSRGVRTMRAMDTGADALAIAAQQFVRDGVVVVRGVLDAAWIEHLRAALDEALSAPTPLAQNLAGTQGGAFRSDMYLSSAFASFREFAM